MPRLLKSGIWLLRGKVTGYGGATKVCGAKGVVKEVLEISGFDSLLDLQETEAAAKSSF